MSICPVFICHIRVIPHAVQYLDSPKEHSTVRDKCFPFHTLSIHRHIYELLQPSLAPFFYQSKHCLTQQQLIHKENQTINTLPNPI